MTAPKHIIEKVFLEINCNNTEKAQHIKNNINRFLQDELFPEIEKLFQNYQPVNDSIRFKNIAINLSVVNWENYTDIIYEVTKQLRKQIEFEHFEKNSGSQVPADELNFLRVPEQKNDEAILLFFLENGYLPWYAESGFLIRLYNSDFWDNGVTKQSFVKQLEKLFLKNTLTFERFVLQFPNEVVFQFISVINEQFAESTKEIKNELKWPPETRILFLIFISKYFINPNIGFWVFDFYRFTKHLHQLKLNRRLKSEIIIGVESILLSAQNRSEIKSVISLLHHDSVFPDLSAFLSANQHIKVNGLIKGSEVTATEDKQFAETKSVLVKNAGLVIVHPFLKTFFRNIGVLSDKDKFLNSKRFIAVQSLHYIATGKTVFFEPEMLLEKFLCNIPFEYPVPSESLLSKEILNETDLMLAELIKNWPALKNTSVAGLREMFFKRDGKLLEHDGQIKLLVERKVQDVLLEKLNWNISIIKLQWKKEIMFVEW